jgi:hypothetical protein
MRQLTLLFALAGAAALAGCERTPHTSLKDAKIPAGFTFATSREVSVKLSGGAAALPASGVGSLEIARPDGKVLYRGRLDARTPVRVKLPVPNNHGQLVATLEGPGGARSAVKLDILDGAVAHAFGGSR